MAWLLLDNGAHKGEKMNNRSRIALLATIVLVLGPAAGSEIESTVDAVERAFAKTMADRDHEAFMTFLSEEAVFLSGTTARRGKGAVADHWKAYFDGPEPPFSWEPETVSVLESGKLAISTGPVWNAEGKRMATYTSIWRQEEPGVWRIIFDSGNKFCD